MQNNHISHDIVFEFNKIKHEMIHIRDKVDMLESTLMTKSEKQHHHYETYEIKRTVDKLNLKIEALTAFMNYNGLQIDDEFINKYEQSKLVKEKLEGGSIVWK